VLTYAWRVASGAGATLTPANGAATAVRLSMAGTVVVELSATDGTDAATDTVTLRVFDAATGPYHSIAARPDGSAWAWGPNWGGQLGFGRADRAKAEPGRVCATGTGTSCATPLAGVAMVAAGSSTSAALLQDGSLWAWGYNGDGQVGDGTSDDRSLPVRVCELNQNGACTTPLTGVGFIAAGCEHWLALKGDGSLWAWGSNYSGQLGDGTTDDRDHAVKVLEGVTKIAPGCESSYALKSDGGLYAWGYNGSGQLGDGTSGDDRLTPVRVCKTYNTGDGSCAEPFAGVVSFAAGDAHALAVTSDGALWAWGRNGNGQLGDGCTIGSNCERSLTPRRIGTGTGWAEVAAGSKHSLALTKDGVLFTWGDNEHGQLGDGAPESRSTPAAVPAGEGRKWMAIARGAPESFSLAFQDDGSLWSWGSNDDGALGDGTAFRVSPALVRGRHGGAPETDWSFLSAGREHVLAGKTGGSLWAWGYNYSGKLGDGTQENRVVPVQVLGHDAVNPDTDWIAASGGNEHSLGLRTDGFLWAWGAGGRLGTGDAERRLTPVKVCASGDAPCTTPFSGVAKFFADVGFSLALKTDGTVWGWGWEYAPPLGAGPEGDRLAPVQICTAFAQGVCTPFTGVADLAVSRYRALAKKSDGSLWAWGEGGPNGNLGAGTDAGSSTPVRLCEVFNTGTQTCTTYFDGADAIALGEHHGLVLRGGALYAWGANWVGQLGDGCTIDDDCVDSLVPKRVGNDFDWVEMAAGTNHTIARKANGTIWSWGNSYTGELGDGFMRERSTPAQVLGRDRTGHDSDWTKVWAGGWFGMAKKSDGSLWAWGSNESGQLGIGGGNASRPVRVEGF
jgi:alpha-tubulin suppressor-like RCC1 family protein